MMLGLKLSRLGSCGATEQIYPSVTETPLAFFALALIMLAPLVFAQEGTPSQLEAIGLQVETAALKLRAELDGLADRPEELSAQSIAAGVEMLNSDLRKSQAELVELKNILAARQKEIESSTTLSSTDKKELIEAIREQLASVGQLSINTDALVGRMNELPTKEKAWGEQYASFLAIKGAEAAKLKVAASIQNFSSTLPGEKVHVPPPRSNVPSAEARREETPAVATPAADNAEVVTQLSKPVAQFGQPVVLVYRFTNIPEPNDMPQPAILVDGLTINFQGTSRRSNFSFGFDANRIQNNSESVIEFTYSVIPLRPGNFTIPGFTVHTGAQQVRIKPASLDVLPAAEYAPSAPLSPSDAATESPKDRSGERYPQTLDVSLRMEDVEGFNAAQLRYAVNEMYARYGLVFRDKQIQRHFERMKWYSPQASLTPAQVEERFTPLEKSNLEVLAHAREQLTAGQSGAKPQAPQREFSNPIAYFSACQEHVDANWKSPSMRFPPGHSAIALVKATIGSDGRLMSTQWIQRSGYKEWDQAVLNCLQRIPPFPAPPAWLGHRPTVQLVFPET